MIDGEAERMEKHPDGARSWTVEALELALAGHRDGGPGAPVSLVLAGVDEVRALTVLGIGRLVSDRHTFVVEQNRPPLAGWRGRLGHLPGLLEERVVWSARRRGPLTVSVVLAAPLDVATVAVAVARLLLPTNVTEHVGSPAVAAAPGAPAAVLALFEHPWATPRQHERDPEALLGNDVVLVPTGSVEPQEAARVVVVGPDGRPGGHDGPVVDLALHNPVRRQAKIDGATPWLSARVVPEPGAWRIHVETRPDVVVDLARPVPRQAVENLRPAAWLDLDAVPVPGDDTERRSFVARLAELAATGIVLHGGGHLTHHLDGLAPDLVTGLARERAPRPGLDTFAPAVAQRRTAMRAHGGRYALAGSLDGGGAGLPHVTVLLVTNRPARVLPFLEQVAAQTYPNLDVVVTLHGVPAPETTAWPPQLRRLVTTTLELDATTMFGDALARATACADGPLVLKMDDDDLYGPEFVWDLVLARAFSGAQVVGKQAELVYLEPFDVTVRRGFGVEDYSEQVAGGTMLASVADIMSVGGWRGVPRAVDRALMQRVVKAGGLTYVDRGVGFVYVRHGEGHTWETSASHFLSNAQEQWAGVHAPALGGAR